MGRRRADYKKKNEAPFIKNAPFFIWFLCGVLNHVYVLLFPDEDDSVVGRG